MKKIKQFLIPNIMVFLMFVFPVFSFAGGLVPDCRTECGWTEILTLVNNVIEFILTKMVIPIAAIMFAYAGFLMLTGGGEAAHARTKAKNIFTNAVIGLLFAVAATLIVKAVLSILGYTEGTWILF